ncbi:alpha/beta fold hydrolase [Oribacterium sp. WCC10]|uniref:alpha/beta fold hydrolase n=1 Tax=Oribacterium sp. WCC10 TaxID=1855343 RepID=UPI0008EE539A|nr:alpha/beta hydrolase [Oribacterium sp. WCC10]SFG21567.1 Pimeloyl-ACP methyl ester carboxylesterase [Oribacterium sp. WCC10]
MSEFVLKNGEKLYYEDKGEGSQTVVMLHGWTGSHTTYDKVVDALKGKVRCITYDHRGHGKSKDANGEKVSLSTLASDLDELLSGLLLNDVTLLGWSMGSGVIMSYIKEFGCDRLKQIVLCDMTPRQLNDNEWSLGLYQGRYNAENMEADSVRPFFDLYKDFALAASPKLKKVPGFILNPGIKKFLLQCDEGVVRSLSASMKTVDNRDFVQKLSVPMYYFYADPGSIFSPELAVWYEENVPTEYHSVKFSNATHMLVNDHPEEVAAELAKILSDRCHG